MTKIVISNNPDAGGLGRDDGRADALEALLSRQSCGRLRPWRFVIIRGSARAAFAEILVEAIKRRESDPQDTMVLRLRKRILGVPLVIGVGARIQAAGPIPEIEQLLSTGAAAMNMLNAIHVLGYGGMWVTGGHAYDRGVNEALGFTWPDRLIGMLFVGTPQVAVRPVRPASADYVREWTGSAGVKELEKVASVAGA